MSVNLSTKEVAARLRTSPQFVRNLIKNNSLKASRIGHSWVINSNDLNEWLKNSGYIIEPIDHPRSSMLIPDKVALSFFTGAGGLDIGMAESGIHPVLVSEIDSSARRSIAANYPEAGLVGDMTKLTPKDVYEYANLPEGTTIDYMFGGPPCQAFSTAGKRRGYHDARGDVFIKYLELIGQLKPRYAVIENVRGLLSTPAIFGEKDHGLKGGVLLYALRRLRHFGYAVSFNLYNAANFGAPEKRERLIIIAKLGSKKVDYLVPTNDEKGRFGLPKWKSFGEAVTGIKGKHYIEYPAKRAKYLKYIPEGGNWRSMPLSIQKEAMGKSWSLPGGKTGFFRRLSRNEPSPTLVTHPTMPATDLIHPLEDRPLSIEEYRRIQGFPDNWRIEGTLLEQYKQIGNAVPIPLAKAIGDRIISDDNGKEMPTIKGFKYSRYHNTDEVSWEKQIMKIIESDSSFSIKDIPQKL